MDRFWTKNYPEGVPENVNVDEFSSLTDLLENSFKKYRDKNAYVFMDKFMTYGDIDERSEILAAYFQNLGLKQGDRVAIMMPNVLQYPVTTAAVLRAGLIVVNVNPLYTARELEHQLKDSGAETIVILENFASVLQEVIAATPIKNVVVASIGDMLGLKGTLVNFVLRYVKKAVPSWSLPGHVKFNDALAAGKGKPFNRPEIKSDDVAVLQYTGGTTGVSKGATLLHSCLVSALLASDAWVQPGLKRDGGIDGDMISICALPLYHVFAFVSVSLLSTRARI